MMCIYVSYMCVVCHYKLSYRPVLTLYVICVFYNITLLPFCSVHPYSNVYPKSDDYLQLGKITTFKNFKIMSPINCFTEINVLFIT